MQIGPLLEAILNQKVHRNSIIRFKTTAGVQSQSHIATEGQSVCLFWCQAPSGAHDEILVTV
jgi:hypothetical protein